MADPQRTADKRLRHLLTPEGVPAAMLVQVVERALAYQASCVSDPASGRLSIAPLEGVDILALDYTVGEGCRPGMSDILDCLAWPIRTPDEPLDPAHDRPGRLAAWSRPGDIVVMSHPESGAAHAVAARVPAGVSVVNIMDGRHAAPLASLSDVATLWRRLPALHTRSIVLRGDLRHAARMRGVIHALTTLGVPQVRVVHDNPALDDAALRLGVQSCRSENLASALTGMDAMLDYESMAEGAPRIHGLPAESAPALSPVRQMATVLAAVCNVLRGPS